MMKKQFSLLTVICAFLMSGCAVNNESTVQDADHYSISIYSKNKDDRYQYSSKFSDFIDLFFTDEKDESNKLPEVSNMRFIFDSDWHLIEIDDVH